MANDQLPKIKILIFLLIVSILLNGIIAFGYSISIASDPTFSNKPVYENGTIVGYEATNSTIDVASFTVTNTALGIIPIANVINSIISFPFPISFIIAIVNIIISAMEIIIIFFIVASQIPIINIGG